MTKNVFMVLVIASLFLGLVSAQTPEPEIRVLPDSAFYGIKIAAEQIRAAFVFGQENKAEYALYLAEKRVAEIRALTQKEGATEKQVLGLRRAEELREHHVEEAMRRIREQGLSVDTEESLRKQEQELVRIHETAPTETKQGLTAAIQATQRQQIGNPTN